MRDERADALRARERAAKERIAKAEENIAIADHARRMAEHDRDRARDDLREAEAELAEYLEGADRKQRKKRRRGWKAVERILEQVDKERKRERGETT